MRSISDLYAAGLREVIRVCQEAGSVIARSELRSALVNLRISCAEHYEWASDLTPALSVMYRLTDDAHAPPLSVGPIMAQLEDTLACFATGTIAG
jgi:hypothetical protein